MARRVRKAKLHMSQYVFLCVAVESGYILQSLNKVSKLGVYVCESLRVTIPDFNNDGARDAGRREVPSIRFVIADRRI